MITTSRSDDRRTQILDAALAIVHESGLSGVSVRNVAARAGVGPSTLRHYFPTQRALSEAIAAEVMHFHLDDRRIRDRRVDPARRLLECLEQFLEPGDDARLAAWLDLVHGAVTRGADSPHTQLLTNFTSTTRQRVAAWLHQLATEGHLRADTVDDATTALLVRIDGLALAIVTHDHRIDHEAAHRILHDDVTRLLEH